MRALDFITSHVVYDPAYNSQKNFCCLSLTNYLISKLQLPYKGVISAIVGQSEVILVLCGRFQFLLITPLGYYISFHAVVVFGLGKNLLFKSDIGHCAPLHWIPDTLLSQAGPPAFVFQKNKTYSCYLKLLMFYFHLVSKGTAITANKGNQVCVKRHLLH